MNIMPELLRELYDLMMNYNLNEALAIRRKLLNRISEWIQIDQNLNINLDILLILRRELEKVNPALKLGPMRRPQLSLNRYWL